MGRSVMRIQIRRSVINGILDYSKIYHPREGVLLLDVAT